MFNDSSISWRKSKGLLQIEGDEMGKVCQHLCKKIINNLHSSVKNVNSSDMSCQTNVDTPRLSSCTCADVVFDIENLNWVKKSTEKAYKHCLNLLNKVLRLWASVKAKNQLKKGES